jgi:hypothetical protein
MKDVRFPFFNIILTCLIFHPLTARRQFQADLAQGDGTFCDAIVYLTSEDSVSLTLSKDELASLLAGNLTVPILVLVISDSDPAASVSEDVLVTQLELDDQDKV